MTLTALALLTVVTATSCTGPASPPRSTATATDSTPGSDRAVLAAAIDSYTRYSAALDAVLARGDGDYTQLAALTTPAYLKRLTDGDVFAANGWTTTGSTSFDSEEVLSHTDSTVSLRLCRDVSRIDIIDANGDDVTPGDRKDRFVVTVGMVLESASGTYLVDSSERQEEDESCER